MAPTTSRRMVASVFLVALILLIASETGTTKVAEARHCVSQSHKYKGHCASLTNCHHVCQTEGFPSGECVTRHLVRSMCFCKKPC